MLKLVLAIQCPKCGRKYTEEQLNTVFTDKQKITFQCLETDGNGCGSIIQANFFIKEEFEDKFIWSKLKKVPVKVSEKLEVNTFLRS